MTPFIFIVSPTIFVSFTPKNEQTNVKTKLSNRQTTDKWTHIQSVSYSVQLINRDRHKSAADKKKTERQKQTVKIYDKVL